MSFEVIKWVYNKTFVKIMKNTVHFRNFRLYHAWFSGNHLIEKGNITHEHAEKGTSVIYFSRNQPHKFIAKKTN